MTDGETGLLFPAGDVDVLAAQTLRAAMDPDLRERIGRAARERAQAHGLPDAVGRYAEALKGVARGHSRVGACGVLG